jgi:vacuolar iron transporter family protein
VSTPTPADLRRWRGHLADERAEARIYRDLARRRNGEEREILFALAEAEGRHVAHWEHLLGDHAGRPHRPGLRFWFFVLMARWFGSVFVLALVQRAETRAGHGIDSNPTSTMAADERIHAEAVRALATRGRNQLAGSFRVAVFGASHGLVFNVALVTGVVAAGTSASVVLLTGLAGLLAGALSMAAGEFISVRSQRELLAVSTPGPTVAPTLPDLDADANELVLVYRARGLSADEARRRADEVLADIALLGSSSTRFHFDPAPSDDPHEAVGTAWGASGSSFCLFASGAVIPVIPYLFGMTGVGALVTALAAVGVALLATGTVVGLISGGPPLWRALRQLAIGYAAATVTYGLGVGFGTTMG